MKIYKKYAQDKQFGLITSNQLIIDKDSYITSHCEFILRGDKVLYKYKYATALYRIPIQNIQFALQNIVLGFENGSIHCFIDQEPIILQGHSQPIKQFQSIENLLLSSTQNELIIWDLSQESGLVRFRERETIHGSVFITPNLIAIATGNVLKIMDIQEKLAIETIVFKDQVSSVEYIDGTLYCSMQDQVHVYKVHVSILEEKVRKEGVGLELTGHVKRNNNNRITKLVFKKEHLAIQTEKTVEVYKLVEKKGVVKEKYVGIVKVRAKIVGFDFECKPTGVKILLSLNNNTVEYVMLEGNQQREVMTFDLQGHRSDIRALCLSSDDELVCSGSMDEVKVWSVRSGNCLLTFESGYVLCCQFVPENKHVIVGTKQGTLELYELGSGNLLETVEAHEGPIWSIQPIKNGFITGSQDKQVKFWTYKLIHDPEYSNIVQRVTVKHTRTLKLSDDVLCVKVSPDERLLACALLDQTVQIFYLDTLKFFLSLYGHKLPVVSMDISSDSRIIITASSDKTVKIWGLDFGDCHKSILAHQDSVMQVGFVWGTYNFFSCGKDKLVKFWDAEKFEEITTLKGHYGAVWSLAIAKYGMFIVTGSQDRTIRIWNKTDEQFVVSEEQEKRMEELFDEMDLDQHFEQKQENEAEQVLQTTIESLKSGELIQESIRVYELEQKDWEKYLEIGGSKPPRNPFVVQKRLENEEPAKVVFEIVKSIRTTHLNDALLTLRFSQVLILLQIIEQWVLKQYEPVLIYRVLFFILNIHHKEIVSSGDKAVLENIKLQLQQTLRNQRSLVGQNLAGLRILATQEKEVNFFGEVEEPTRGVKRIVVN